MNKQFKEKKILHKVKKNWVVIGMTTVTFLGAGYVASQGVSIVPTAVVAHAAASNSAAPASNVSANLTSSSSTSIYSNQSATYQVSLTNNNQWGNYIPKGTQIKLSFNLNDGKKLSDLIGYRTYTENGNANVFDVSSDGSSIVLTTNTDIYAGSRNVSLTLTANDKIPADTQLPFTTSLTYNGVTSQISQSSIEIKAKSGFTNPPNGEPLQMGAYPFNVKQDPSLPTYPDAPNGYSLADANENLVSKGTNTGSASYAPIKTNDNGLPYFVALTEFNGSDRGFKADTLILGDGTSDSHIDPNSLRVYAIDGDKYVDITNTPGVNISYDSGANQYFADVSNSPYNGDTLDFVAYVTYQQLTKNMYIHGWIHYHADGSSDIISSQMQQSTISIVPGKNNTNEKWIVAPDKIVYTDDKGNYNISDDDLLNGVSAYQATQDGFTQVDNSQVTVNDRDNLPNNGQIAYNADNPTKYSISYKVDGQDTPVKREVEVINPYENVKKNVTLTAKVNYVDADTNQPISGVDSATNSVVYTNEGVTNTLDGKTNWNGDWTVTSGQKDYSFTTPEVSGYELVDANDKVVSGTLDSNGDSFEKNVLLKRIEQPNSSSTATDSSAASSSEASQSSSAQSSAHSSSAESSAQSSSAESSAQSSSAQSSAHSSSAESSAHSSSAESSAQSSSAESSAQSSSAQSSAHSSSAESSAQSSDAQSSAQSSSAQSSAHSSSAESSAQSSSAQSSAQSSSVGSSASNHVVVPGSSSHDNHNGNPDTDKNETSTQSEESHKNNAVNPLVEHKGNTNPVNKDANRLPQTGDQTHENVVVAVGTALISIALGLAFFASRRKRK
ncbi:LPXTG cell wall anchor domain-containing protein [Lactobacillus sp. B3795]|uniref:LPXTG cell wall anchor domain-containing protein n=1 Tax=Lactobacillus sp. B3795 TaxID=2818036 RepID=UPI00265CC4E0|nr:LPXTG cell wall anchor domain-containing protein [Lactobacillus sp. B3795]MCX8743571.1 LPXTG cell wall anchor domain-containing protein [Lactobacillus sp. B3795]